MLFIVPDKWGRGKTGKAFNHMNFGNFLTGAALNALGFPETISLLGGHLNSLFGKNGYKEGRQFDSFDDQGAISDGWNYGLLNNYRTKIIKTKIIVSPLK